MNQPLDNSNPQVQWERRWSTTMGGWFPGQRVVLRGRDLFTELNDLSWMALWLFGITGSYFSPRQLQLFEGIWSLSTSFPDPRLWNNRIAALAGTSRSTTSLGISAGIAVSEATIYGNRPLLAAFSFLQKIQEQLATGKDLQDLLVERLDTPAVGKPGCGRNRQVARIPGFGRPLVSRDERLVPLLQLAKKLSLADGDCVRLAHRIEGCLEDMGEPLRMNVATLMAALSADQGLTARQYYHYISLCFSAGMMPCAIDAQQHPEGALFPLRCQRIRYTGPPLRKWHTVESQPSSLSPAQVNSP